VPDRYSLSARAARSILERARRRGRRLPAHLVEALERVAEWTATPTAQGR
jgi:hypothetical protein